MDDTRILGLILDIGNALIQSGAETMRVEDSLYRLSEAYGFRDVNIWVVRSNIQATVTTPQDEVLTQIRYVRGMGTDFDRLDGLNDLCRRVCAEVPDPERLAEELQSVLERPAAPVWTSYLAGVLAGAGFGVFFGCAAIDALVCVFASLLITFLGKRLNDREHNVLIYNFLIAFCAESFILAVCRSFPALHPGLITVGVVMLLISALSVTNGVRDLVHLDTLSGLMNITASLAGAIGIAFGIALPLLLFKAPVQTEIGRLASAVPLQLLSCTAGCTGFGLWFGVQKKRQIAVCAAGAFLTWLSYLAAGRFTDGIFAAIFFASFVCALYAQVMARICKAPATIFQTISVFPLIPGAALYYTMYGIVIGDRALAAAKGADLALTCFGIVLGFMAMEVLSRYIWPQSRPVR